MTTAVLTCIQAITGEDLRILSILVINLLTTTAELVFRMFVRLSAFLISPRLPAHNAPFLRLHRLRGAKTRRLQPQQGQAKRCNVTGYTPIIGRHSTFRTQTSRVPDSERLSIRSGVSYSRRP